MALSNKHWQEGYDARHKGRPMTANPHRSDIDAHSQWEEGWSSADIENEGAWEPDHKVLKWGN